MATSDNLYVKDGKAYVRDTKLIESANLGEEGAYSMLICRMCKREFDWPALEKPKYCPFCGCSNRDEG